MAYGDINGHCPECGRSAEIEQENEKLKADVARMRDQYYELAGIAADVDAGNGFDVVCRRTLRRVMDALYATASSDAWLKERDALLLLEVSEYPMFRMTTDSWKYAEELQRMAAELRASASKLITTSKE